MSACRGDFGVELTSCVDSHSCAWASTKRRGRPASGERRAGIRVRVRVGFSLERRLDLAAPSLRDLTDPVPSSRRLSPRLLWRARDADAAPGQAWAPSLTHNAEAVLGREGTKHGGIEPE